MKKGLVIKKKITRESSRAFLGGQVALTTIVTPDYSLTFILCFCCPTTTITFPENTLQYFSGVPSAIIAFSPLINSSKSA